MITIPQITGHSLYLIGPVLIFTCLAFISLLWGAIAPRAAARGSLWLGIAGALGSLAMVASQWDPTARPGDAMFSGMVSVDGFSMFFTALTSAIVILVLLISRDYLDDEGINVGEFYTLLFFCVDGIILLSMSNDLMLMFVAVELMSIAAYVLTGFNRGNFACIEGALKYYILGSFASGFLLFGIALIYGATGTTNIAAIGDLLEGSRSIAAAIKSLGVDPTRTPEVLPIGIGLLIVGLAFKIGAAPFHMWVPDVYQGAPAPVTAFMSTAIKAAAFAAFVRILVVAIPGLESLWAPMVVAIAATTMVIGNMAALVQRDIKRMLAYSSVAHGGYAMMGFLAIDAGSQSNAVSAILTYLVAYAAMNIGAFAVVIYLQNKADLEVTDLESYGGIGFKHPLVAAAMTIFMISLGGLPPTAGFIAKFNLFSAVVGAGYIWLVLLALVTSMASMYYYIRVVVYMYMRPEFGEVTLRRSALPGLVVGLSALAVMAFGLLPSTGPLQFLQWAKDSVQALL